jgi:hypothetical protein
MKKSQEYIRINTRIKRICEEHKNTRPGTRSLCRPRSSLRNAGGSQIGPAEQPAWRLSTWLLTHWPPAPVCGRRCRTAPLHMPREGRGHAPLGQLLLVAPTALVLGVASTLPYS